MNEDLGRRAFLVSGGAAVLAGGTPRTAASAAARPVEAQGAAAPPSRADTADDEPAITSATIAEAEKLAGVEYTAEERDVIVATIGSQIERARERRRHGLPNHLAPAQVFDARPWAAHVPGAARLVRSADPGRPLPRDDDAIAFAPVTALSRWIERGELTSRRLTEIYLRRLRRLGPRLECTVTLTEERALAQADRADREIAAGSGPRGSLHGIPWGAKDLLDTRGTRTTWGATPYRDRVAESDATVVRLLDEAGAVLVAKLTLGALAYGDIWFGGTTRSPWNLERGSSGSSAGSASATAAGLVGFAIGTETLGSIVSPCMRCGTTGLRPTFGRVSRAGAMALCWSLDKIGPIARTVEDTALVLDAITGADPDDPSSVSVPFAFDARRPIAGMRVGYRREWFEGEGADELDRAALDAARAAGVELVEIELPDWPYGTLLNILFVEAAAAFEELTLDGRDDTLVWQAPEAWPNTFRRTHLVSAIEYVQAERFRREVATMMAAQFDGVDAMISPSYAASLLLITNSTGHPSLTLRCGFREGEPHGITLWGRLFDEGSLLRLGMEIERRLAVWDRRPNL